MFTGHKFIKLINDNWVLDVNEFKAYKVDIDKNKNVVKRTLAFKVKLGESGDIGFEKFIDTPVKVLKEARNIVSSLMEYV